MCTQNFARSQMAEGLLRHHAGDRFEAYSAGLLRLREQVDAALEADEGLASSAAYREKAERRCELFVRRADRREQSDSRRARGQRRVRHRHRLHSCVVVLATLHTNDAPGAVSRLNDMGVEPYLTAAAVDCVVAQRLARRLCPNCARPVDIGKEVLSGMQFPFRHLPEDGPGFREAAGCSRCGGTGYRGRIGLYELMMVTDEIREMIARRASAGEIANAAERDGMTRLKDDGLLKAARGLTTIEEVLRTVV